MRVPVGWGFTPPYSAHIRRVRGSAAEGHGFTHRPTVAWCVNPRFAENHAPYGLLLGVSLGGGLRKWRVARLGGGKSGGYRVVHFFAPSGGGPVFLLTMFAKNEKANLSPREVADLMEIARRIAESYGRRR